MNETWSERAPTMKEWAKRITVGRNYARLMSYETLSGRLAIIVSPPYESRSDYGTGQPTYLVKVRDIDNYGMVTRGYWEVHVSDCIPVEVVDNRSHSNMLTKFKV